MNQAAAGLLGALLVTSSSGAQLPNVPAGYEVTVFHQAPAGELLTALDTDPAGRIYFLTDNGVVRRVADYSKDGVSDYEDMVWDGSGINAYATGILNLGSSLYISHLNTISRITDSDQDGVLDTRTDVVTDMPSGWHQNNNLFTDGSLVYFGLGSQTDHDLDPDPRSATLMMYDPAQDIARPLSRGLRNIFDGVVHPVTGDVIAGDNGPNLVPDNMDPADEINLVIPYHHYGHPHAWGETDIDFFEEPLMVLPSHSSPCGMAINANRGMSGYRNEVAMTLLSGLANSVVKMPIIYGERPGEVDAFYETFADGFETPIDVVFDKEGAMYVGEYLSGKIFRISQTGTARVVIEGRSSIGETCSISLESPATPFDFAFPVASSSLSAPVNLGAPGMDSYLDASNMLFNLSVSGKSPVFDFPQPTLLDADGKASIQIHFPDDPSIVGISFWIQFSAWDLTLGLPTAVSPPQSVRILDNF